MQPNRSTISSGTISTMELPVSVIDEQKQHGAQNSFRPSPNQWKSVIKSRDKRERNASILKPKPWSVCRAPKIPPGLLRPSAIKSVGHSFRRTRIQHVSRPLLAGQTEKCARTVRSFHTLNHCTHAAVRRTALRTATL
jgi:hypothetical protein